MKLPNLFRRIFQSFSCKKAFPSLYLIRFMFFLFLYFILFYFLQNEKGERTYTHKEVTTVQYGAVVGQVNMAHQPPNSTVRAFTVSCKPS